VRVRYALPRLPLVPVGAVDRCTVVALPLRCHVAPFVPLFVIYVRYVVLVTRCVALLLLGSFTVTALRATPHGRILRYRYRVSAVALRFCVDSFILAATAPILVTRTACRSEWVTRYAVTFRAFVAVRCALHSFAGTRFAWCDTLRCRTFGY